MRRGLLDQNGREITMLLPHSAVELELSGEGCELLLQFYQGTEGLCGWEALNDLQRPWQNDRHNGTVRYMGEPWQGGKLLELMDLTDVMAHVHNSLASELQLRWGGYGTVGYCIDTTALVQQALEGQCNLFPLLLNGIWRERLLRTSNSRPAAHCVLPAGADGAATRSLPPRQQQRGGSGACRAASPYPALLSVATHPPRAQRLHRGSALKTDRDAVVFMPSITSRCTNWRRTLFRLKGSSGSRPG